MLSSARAHGLIVSLTSKRGNTRTVATITIVTIADTFTAARYIGDSQIATMQRRIDNDNATTAINIPLTCGSTLISALKNPKPTAMNAIVPASMKTAILNVLERDPLNSGAHSSASGGTMGSM